MRLFKMHCQQAENSLGEIPVKDTILNNSFDKETCKKILKLFNKDSSIYKNDHDIKNK